MFILVGKKPNIEYNEKKIAEKLVNDLSDFSLHEIWNNMTDEIVSDTSVRFYSYKWLFTNANQNSIVNVSYWSYLDIEDKLYLSYLRKLAKTVGCINVVISDTPCQQDNIDDEIVAFNSDRDFYVDLLTKIKPKINEISKDPLYQVVKSINGYGYYLGSTNSKKTPTKIIHLNEYGSGQKISFEEYLGWYLKTYDNFKNISIADALKETENYAFVRSRHPVELLSKTIEKKS